MTNDFCEATLFANQTALKKYLANCEISTSQLDDQRNTTISDNGYGGLLFFRRDIPLKTFKSHCDSNDFEVNVVIKVLLNKDTKVITIGEKGETQEGILGESEEAIAFLVKENIPFVNVQAIIPVEREIVFLQGDSTIKEPTALLQERFYTPASVLSEDAVTAILNAAISLGGSKPKHLQESLDSEDGALDFAFFEKKDEKNPLADSCDKGEAHRKFLAGLLMLAQGDRPTSHRLTASLHAVLNGKNSFKDSIETNFYPTAPGGISRYLAEPNGMIVRFTEELEKIARKVPSSDSLFSSAILASLKSDGSKDCFQKLFIDGIKDPATKKKAEDCLNNPRARDMIASLKESQSDILPVYMLYVFYDYGFDSLNQNIREFGLKGTAYTALLFALWGLKNGVDRIYEEYKDPEIVYACEERMANWFGDEEKVVPIDVFLKANKIALQENEKIIGNFRCSYLNLRIEYACLYAEVDAKVIQEIEKLEKIQKKAFKPKFAPLDEAFKKIKAFDLTAYASEIHKNYLASLKKAKTKEKAKEMEQKWEQGKLL